MGRNSTFCTISLLRVRGLGNRRVLFSSLVRSLRVVGLSNERRTLITACPSNVSISDGCVLVRPSNISTLGLFAHGKQCITSVNKINRNPKRCGCTIGEFLSRGRKHMTVTRGRGVLFFSLGNQFLSGRDVSLPRAVAGDSV